MGNYQCCGSKCEEVNDENYGNEGHDGRTCSVFDQDGAHSPVSSAGGVTIPLDVTPSADSMDMSSNGDVALPSTVLTTTVTNFEIALIPDESGIGPVTDLKRGALIDGLEAFATVLDRLGGGMGGYLMANTKKMRESKARALDNDSYREWLLSELPVHAATGYKGYVDDSAWMGNLWIAWLMQFFIELFANMDAGGETTLSAGTAYSRTLQAHHSFFQKTAFNQAVKQLPPRSILYNTLKGEAPSSDDVERDVSRLVAAGRPIVEFCLQMNILVEETMFKERYRR